MLNHAPIHTVDDVLEALEACKEQAGTITTTTERVLLAKEALVMFEGIEDRFTDLFGDMDNTLDIDRAIFKSKTGWKLVVENQYDTGFFDEAVDNIDVMIRAINGEWSAPEPRAESRFERAGNGHEEYVSRKREQARQVGVPPAHRP